MLYYEFRKIFNWKNVTVLLVLFLLSAGCFFIQMWGVKNGGDTAPAQMIYGEIKGMTVEEAGEYLRERTELIQDTLGREQEMETGYRKGKINADDYLQYRDLYHECYARQEITEHIYERWQETKQNGWQMVFDSYYNQLFDPGRIPWGFLLTIFFIGVFPVIREPGQLLRVLQVSRQGSAGLWRAKLRTVGILCALAAVLYTGAEYLIAAHFYPFYQLSAPVQSISVLSGMGIPVSIRTWFWVWAVCRIVSGVLAGEILFGIQYKLVQRILA